MNTDEWLKNLQTYYQDLPESGPEQDEKIRKAVFCHLPWWRLAVRIDSREGWNYVNRLQWAPTRFRFVFKRMMTALSSFPPARRSWGTSAVPIHPAGSNWDIFFYGRGRYKILLMDLSRKIVLALSRDPQSREQVQHEIHMREEFQDVLTLPECTRADDEGLYYEEKMVDGAPLDSLNEKALHDSLRDIYAQLWTYYSRCSIHQTSLTQYFGQLQEQIRPLIQNKSAVVSGSGIKNAAGILENYFGKAQDISVQITQVHGDLHAGNILSSDGKNYLLDWECSAVRSLYYDWFNLHMMAKHASWHPIYRKALRSFIPTHEEKDRFADYFKSLTGHEELYQGLYLAERLLFELNAPVMKSSWLELWKREIEKWGQQAHVR